MHCDRCHRGLGSLATRRKPQYRQPVSRLATWCAGAVPISRRRHGGRAALALRRGIARDWRGVPDRLRSVGPSSSSASASAASGYVACRKAAELNPVDAEHGRCDTVRPTIESSCDLPLFFCRRERHVNLAEVLEVQILSVPKEGSAR